MRYSEFAIEQLKERLLELSLKNSTQKKYAGTMLEAYEVINQLQRKRPGGATNSTQGNETKTINQV